MPRTRQTGAARLFNELVIAYLFLGGVGSGAVLAVAVTQARGALARLMGRPAAAPPDIGDRTVAFCLLWAMALVAVGALCLVADLDGPQAAQALVLNLTPSWIAFGFVSLGLLFAAGFLLLGSYYLSLPLARFPWREVSWLACLLLSIAVMLYTGCFLFSMGGGTPLWGSPSLPVLFLLSSASGGTGVVVLAALFREGSGALPWARRLMRVDFWLVAAETASAVWFVLDGLEQLAVVIERPSAFPGAATAFAVFAVLGLAAPLVLEHRLAHRATGGKVLAATVAVFVIIGSAALRYGIIEAGAHPDATGEFLAQAQPTMTIPKGQAP